MKVVKYQTQDRKGGRGPSALWALLGMQAHRPVLSHGVPHSRSQSRLPSPVQSSASPRLQKFCAIAMPCPVFSLSLHRSHIHKPHMCMYTCPPCICRAVRPHLPLLLFGLLLRLSSSTSSTVAAGLVPLLLALSTPSWAASSCP